MRNTTRTLSTRAESTTTHLWHNGVVVLTSKQMLPLNFKNMSQPSKLTKNLELLASMRAKNPSATHVYVRRFKRGVDIGWVDIPIEQAEQTLKQNPDWELLSSNKQMDDEVEQLFNEPAPAPKVDDVELPPKPSEEAPAAPAPATPAPEQAETPATPSTNAKRTTRKAK